MATKISDTPKAVKVQLHQPERVSAAQIMTPGNPHWPAFSARMTQLKTCKNNLDHTVATLGGFGVDIEASVEFLLKNGGHCDCEVIMNVIFG